MVQRIIDLFLSTLALIILFPFILFICLILRFTGEGEIFYIQDRVGKDGIKFKLFKFSTMLKDSPNLGTGTVTIKNDPRILPFGRILRKAKINELPQLLNVVLGDMSLIGPRPLTTETFHAYPAHAQDLIKKMKPGLSGVGSIVLRNEESLLTNADDNNAIYLNIVAPYKAELETWYYNNSSLRLYLMLIIITIYVVIRPNSKVIWRLFPVLPVMPSELHQD